MAKPPATATLGTQNLRKQLAEAVLQGYMDAAMTSHIGAARAAGFVDNIISDRTAEDGPIGGVNS
jgi:hypothetical protein